MTPNYRGVFEARFWSQEQCAASNHLKLGQLSAVFGKGMRQRSVSSSIRLTFGLTVMTERKRAG